MPMYPRAASYAPGRSGRGRFVEIIWGLLSMALVGIGSSTLLGFLGRAWWVIDLFSHFRVQYCLLLSALLLIFLGGGKYLQALACAAFALLNLGLILPIYRKIRPHFQAWPGGDAGNPNPSSSPVYRVLLANVLQRNREFDRVRELIRSADPDIILLIEINQNWVDQLQPVLGKYPHSVKPLREDSYGLGLFSKFPFIITELAEFGEAKVPSVVARLELNGQPITIIGTHPPPPKKAWMAHQRDAQLKEIARSIANQPGPAMLLGDLNLSPWSPHFQETLRLGRLKDSRQGWSWQPSWPVDRLPFLIPIDHILVTGGIAVHRRWRGPNTGSDHYPVLVEFSLCPSQSTK